MSRVEKMQAQVKYMLDGINREQMFQNKRSVKDFIIAVNQAGGQRREKRKLEKIMNRALVSSRTISSLLTCYFSSQE